METQKIRLNGTESIEQILGVTDHFIKLYGLSDREGARLRHTVEETLEMIRSLEDEPDGEFRMEGYDDHCVIRLTCNGEPSSKKAGSIPRGVSGKISLLLNSRFDTIGSRAEEFEDIGVFKASEDDLRLMGLKEPEEAYVWTLRSYNRTSFDKMEENDAGSWFEVSRSILANLADDIRVFVFRDRSQLTIFYTYHQEEEDPNEGFGISPEFDALKKIPVAKSLFQVRLVQLMYKRIIDKQQSTDEIRVKNHKLPLKLSGKGELTVLEYSPVELDDNDAAPCVLLLHGGAFMFPALPYHYRLAAAMSKRGACRVFMPMYSLAPKHNPPVQEKESFLLYRYLLDHAEEYRIDKDRIAFIGDSSGGTVAAGLALKIRDEALTPPKGVLLLYPSVDSRKDSESMKIYTDVPVINANAIRSYEKMIHSDKEEGKEYYLSPAEAESLEGFPKAYVETTEFDPLHDEGIAFAKRLKEEGCQVILNETKGTVHAFDMAKNSSILAAAMDRRVAFLTWVLE